MSVAPEELDRRHRTAIEECNRHIEWYAYNSRQQKWFHYGSLIVIGLLGVVGAIIGTLGDQVPLIGRVTFPALTTLMAFLTGNFKWQGEWIRFSMTLQALKSELFKYETAATQEYGDDVPRVQRIANFANRIASIVQNEAVEWQTLLGSSNTRPSP